ncbi:MAG: DUF2058 domain-containing protein [Gammaproteobacteria bacterium]
MAEVPPLSKSLQDQLISAGLVSSKQAKQTSVSKSKKRRQDRQQKTAVPDQTKTEIERKAAEKAERDRALNQRREEEKQRREIQSQIKLLIEENRIAQADDGEAFHFDHKGFIKKVYVADSIRLQIVKGQIAIVFCEKRYHLVPSETALKIKNRDESALVLLQAQDTQEQKPEVDPDYAEYQIPDDLIW